MEENNTNWENCVGVCIDGDRSMAGCYARLQALLHKEAHHAIWTTVLFIEKHWNQKAQALSFIRFFN